LIGFSLSVERHKKKPIMKVKGIVNGMTVEKSVNNLSDYVEYVRNSLDFEVSDIDKIQRID